MKKFLFFSVLVLMMIGCDESSNKKILASSTGRFNELLVVIPQQDWEGEVGTALKKVITADVLGLPQPEPQFSVIQIEPQMYKGLLNRSRNILIVSKSDKDEINFEPNLHAQPQVVVNINWKTSESIIALIEQNAEKLVSTYKQSDLLSLQNKPAYPIINPTSIDFFKKQNVRLNIPNNYLKIDDKDDFLWFRNETYNPGVDVNGSMNIIAYTLPLKVPFSQIKDSIVSIRDYIGQKELPGPHPDTYMITEAAYTPNIFAEKWKGLNVYKTIGKWEIKNGYMAGPFLNYTIEDLPNKRLIVIEGFVYAPSVAKRDYMFELEAILNTFKFKK